MVESARLESVYTLTAYREFESLHLRHFLKCIKLKMYKTKHQDSKYAVFFVGNLQGMLR